MASLGARVTAPGHKLTVTAGEPGVTVGPLSAGVRVSPAVTVPAGTAANVIGVPIHVPRTVTRIQDAGPGGRTVAGAAPVCSRGVGGGRGLAKWRSQAAAGRDRRGRRARRERRTAPALPAPLSGASLSRGAR